eukprot:30228_1
MSLLSRPAWFIICLALLVTCKHHASPLPTPLTCFTDAYNFFSCCTNGLPGCNTTESCWNAERTQPICCLSEGNSVEWEYCMNDPKYILQELRVKPAPVVIGSNCSVKSTLFYNSSQGDTTTNGSLVLRVYKANPTDCTMLGIGHVIRYDLSKVVKPFPIKAGSNFTSSFNVSSQTIPQNVSAGIYMVNVEFIDQNDKTLGCISTLVQFVKSY